MTDDNEDTQARILHYARNKFGDDIENLLDDPHGWFGTAPPGEVTAWFRDRRQLAQDLGLDFDAIVQRTGTEFERERLQKIEAKARAQ